MWLEMVMLCISGLMSRADRFAFRAENGDRFAERLETHFDLLSTLYSLLSVLHLHLPFIEVLRKDFSQVLGIINAPVMNTCKFKPFFSDGRFQSSRFR